MQFDWQSFSKWLVASHISYNSLITGGAEIIQLQILQTLML